MSQEKAKNKLSGRTGCPRSVRAKFVTTALEKGATLEDVQRNEGRPDPNTTMLYDRRGYNPEKLAAFSQRLERTDCGN
ncbi:MAG: hypothetical protein M3O30_19455 [Planctomycetota bacterium]|nr:hypothetical protein [Planctomycetota bacterium]